MMFKPILFALGLTLLSEIVNATELPPVGGTPCVNGTCRSGFSCDPDMACRPTSLTTCGGDDIMCCRPGQLAQMFICSGRLVCSAGMCIDLVKLMHLDTYCSPVPY